MRFSFYNSFLSRLPGTTIPFCLFAAVLQLISPVHIPAAHADENIPEFYRGQLNGYYVEMVVDWLPDKSVEGEIWTASQKVTSRELGFDSAKVRGDNQLSGHLELEIVDGEVREENDTREEKPLGMASLEKTLTGDYIEWRGKYKRSTGETVPMTIYRERNLSGETKQADESDEQESSPDEHGLSGTGSCEAGVCPPVWINVCVEKKRAGEAREYFEWLKFPVAVPCASQSGDGCVRDSLCAGESWVLEVDGFSEPYWEQELESLPFIISARRTGEEAGHDTGIIEMPITSFFSGSVPDNEEAVKNIAQFFNEYFSDAIADGSVEITMKERTKFNYAIDILGASSSLSLHKPGLWEHHHLRIVMSRPYPYDYPEKFAVYMGIPDSQYIKWTGNEKPPTDKFLPMRDDGHAAFLEKMVSAFAYRYRAAVWTP
jgi:hypothetical protein